MIRNEEWESERISPCEAENEKMQTSQGQRLD